MKKHMRETIACVRTAFPDARDVRVEGGSRHPKVAFELAGSTIRAPIAGTPSVADHVAPNTIKQLRRQLGTMEARP